MLFVIIVCIGLFIFAYITASLSKAATDSYARMNTIIVKSYLPLDSKMKLVGFIEKLGGPDITIYCLDLFPLNNYNFYLFIAGVVRNFFLIVDVMK